MKPVITRQLAYLTTRHINLCEDHDSDEACGYARGPVSHGRHDGVCDVWCAMQQPNDTMPARETAATIEAAMEHDPADTGTLPWRRDYVGRDRLQNRRR